MLGTGKKSTGNTSGSKRLLDDSARLMLYFAGLQTTLVSMGFLQERIITQVRSLSLYTGNFNTCDYRYLIAKLELSFIVVPEIVTNWRVGTAVKRMCALISKKKKCFQ